MNNKISWEDYGIYSDQLPTDWQHVVTVGDIGGYDWATLHAFWSPTARRFFWGSGSGCSCNYWGEDFRTEADFENGSKADLLRAIRTFAEESYSVSTREALNAIGAVRTFGTKGQPS